VIQNTVPQGGTKDLDSVVSCIAEAVELFSCELLGVDEMINLVVVLLPSVMLSSSMFSDFESFAIFCRYSLTPFSVAILTKHNNNQYQYRFTGIMSNTHRPRHVLNAQIK